jgi:multidrug efflux system membrane fusion protein
VPVTVSQVVARDVPVELRAIGNVQAYATVSVLSLVGGEVFKIHFTEGQDVKAGDLLFSIDPRPFQAALQQAQAQLAQHQAQVAQAQANLTRDTAQYENARVEETRYKRLVEGGFIAREQYDQVRTNEQSLAATIEADRAAITTAQAVARADEAMVDNAKVQLSYTEIRAPLDGRTGNILIHQGNVVKANDVGNPLVVINRVHPIYVAFSVPEQYLDRIKRYRAAGELGVETMGPGSTDRGARGDLSFINNAVDPNTGTIQLKATFQNADNALWPGQFVNVVLTLTTERGALVVPSQAIQPGQQGSYVFVVKTDLTVENRPVAVAFADGPNTVIAKGLAAGERVVTDGQLRLVPGTRVEIKSEAAPAAKGGAG